MNLSNLLESTTSLQLLSLIFLAILFLQSGLDKVFNYKGNLEWLQGHFAKSPLKNTVGLLMPTITLLEVVAGLCCAIGAVMLIVSGNTQIGLIGGQLSALSILALFFGQRLAQDYEGAGNLVGYFLVCLAAIYLLG
ncbi:MAG: DoxX family membrane protein [Chitinophagales bacterium]